jgi:cell wall assembly regulator SMI1
MEFVTFFKQETMGVQFRSLGLTEEELYGLIKLGLKYDKRQKKEMLAARKARLPTEEDVRKFEFKIGFNLPLDYRRFLIEKNGDVPNKSLIAVPNFGKQVVQKFYALAGPANSYTLNHLLQVYNNRVPDGMLPIADDPSGNLFIVELKTSEDYGKLYFWNHEQEADQVVEPTLENISLISSNFSEFLGYLKGEFNE